MQSAPSARAPREGYLTVGTARLFYREVGQGLPIIVLHGGPEFDHSYLRPELDRLAESFRLTYYDQRGRGRSAGGVTGEDVTIESEVEDLDAIREHLGLQAVALLGHSWGAVLAMEYAARHPDRVSHLVLLNSAPASHQDLLIFKQHLLGLRSPDDIEGIRKVTETIEFRRGDLDAEADWLRIHFRVAGSSPEKVDRLVGRLRAHFDEKTVLLAREIERRLSEQTWMRDDYHLLPAIGGAGIPTLVVHGDRDFIPIEITRRIAEAVPGGQLSVVPDSGHFTYMDQPERVHELVVEFLQPDQHGSVVQEAQHLAAEQPGGG